MVSMKSLVNLLLLLPLYISVTDSLVQTNIDKILKKNNFINDVENSFNNISPFILVDGLLTTPELIKKYGYPVEIHHVTTPDGYILEMHRIPRAGGIPVYLQHGIMDSSAGWILTGPEKGLGYILYDLGYDVWMGNIRGNRYSRNHVFIDPDASSFWDFSFHETGIFDIPAMLDYVIQNTSFTKIHYIAHSQGTTAFWVMCSTRPGYCDKVISMNALAPVAFMGNSKSPGVKVFGGLTYPLAFILRLLGTDEFFPNNDLFKMLAQVLCKETAITQLLCYNAMFLFCGYDSSQLNKTTLPVILGHVPAGSSIKQFVHFGQIYKSGKFQMFDYGWFGNFRKYRKLRPPLYDLTKVSAPIALHYSTNDWLSDIKDVQTLQNYLPNIIKSNLVKNSAFNHLDFLWAVNSKEVVYDEVINILKIMEQKELTNLKKF